MVTVSVTTVGATWTIKGEHTGVGPWLGLIHECNRMDATTFTQPEFVNDERGYVEVYPNADVIHVGETAQTMLVTVVSKTWHGASLIKRAAESMDLEYTETAE